MPKNITCFDDFQSALLEVELILYYARRNQKNSRKYYTFIKSALILLISKFEAFLENLIVDYIELIEKMGLRPEDLPEVLKLHCIDKLIDERFITEIRNHRANVLTTIEMMSRLCFGDDKVESIDIDTSFDYGKHGENSINKLFSRIGIQDVFESCKIYEKRETLSSDEAIDIPVNIAADVNALTNIRNNILHGDATPSLTHEQLENYKKHIIMFSSQLVGVLDNRIDNLTNH